MDRLTKSQKREVRELRAKLWNEDAKRTLAKLDERFLQWRRGEIGHDELLEAIHKFHQEDQRQLWSRYADSDSEWIITLALLRGELTLEDLSDGLRQRFAKHPV